MQDERVDNYNKEELVSILQDNRYYSSEDSESEGELENLAINIYNLSWRLDEVHYFVQFYLYNFFKFFN